MRFLGLPVVLALFGLVGCAAEADGEPSPEGTEASELNAQRVRAQLFACKTEQKVDGKIVSMAFSIKKTGAHRVDVFDKNGNEAGGDVPAPVAVTPKGTRIESLNDNVGASIEPSVLRVSGDADGFFLLELVLFENTGYENGFIRIFDPDPTATEENAFSKVHCHVTSS